MIEYIKTEGYRRLVLGKYFDLVETIKEYYDYSSNSDSDNDNDNDSDRDNKDDPKTDSNNY
jgi:hypothetical protein